MIRYSKTISIYIAFAMVTILANGQQQIRLTEDIPEKFKKFCEAIPREEIYVHTDRDDYIAGEEMWFNAYLVDRTTAKPSDGSKIVYVELLNPVNRPVIQKRIKIEEGFGPGMVIIPDTLSTGEYTLRAYTNWMKNFLPENCFIKGLNIYNALLSRRFSGTGNKTSTLSESSITRDFTQTGFEAYIVNTVSGMPEIIIVTNQNFRSVNGNLCYLLIRTLGVIEVNKYEYLAGDTTRISVHGKSLTPGINHITLFNSGGEPLFERYIYTPSDSKNLIILTSPVSAGTREKILLDIESGKEYVESSGIMYLSISVTPETERNKPSGIADYMIFGSEFGILPDEIRNNKLSEIQPEIIDRFLQSTKSNWIDWQVILSGKLPELKYKIEKEDHFISGNLVNINTRDPDSASCVFLSIPGKIAGFQYSKTDKDGYFSLGIPVSETMSDIIIQPEDTERDNAVEIESPFAKEYPEILVRSVANDKEAPPDILRSCINYQVRKIYGISSIGDTLPPVDSLPEPKRFYGKPDIELIMDDYIKLPVMEEVFFELMPGVSLKNRKSKYEITIADPVEKRIYYKPPVLFIDGVVINDPGIIAGLDPELVEKIDAVKDKYFVGDYLFYGLVNVISRIGDYSCVSMPDYAVRMFYRVVDPVVTFSSPDYSVKERKQNHIPDFRNLLYWNPSLKSGSDGRISVEFWASDYVSDYEINIQGITHDGKTISYSGNIRIE